LKLPNISPELAAQNQKKIGKIHVFRFGPFIAYFEALVELIKRG
jgi:hypothetical protein